MSPTLDPRARSLLRTLIAQHIGDGEPVGQPHAGQAVGPGRESATIRNIMADLEEIGLISAPHTSAGRADGPGLSRLRGLAVADAAPAEPEIARLRSQMPVGAGTQALLANASELLSAMSQFVGVVTVPQRAQSPSA